MARQTKRKTKSNSKAKSTRVRNKNVQDFQPVRSTRSTGWLSDEDTENNNKGNDNPFAAYGVARAGGEICGDDNKPSSYVNPLKNPTMNNSYSNKKEVCGSLENTTNVNGISPGLAIDLKGAIILADKKKKSSSRKNTPKKNPNYKHDPKNSCMTLKEAEQERKKMKTEQSIASHERLPDLPPRHEGFKSISIEDIIIQQVEKKWHFEKIYDTAFDTTLYTKFKTSIEITALHYFTLCNIKEYPEESNGLVFCDLLKKMV